MKTENVMQVRFVTPVQVGLKHVQQVDHTSDWDIELLENVVAIKTKVASEKGDVEHVEHVTYVPLAQVVFLKCEPIEVPKAKTAAQVKK